MTPAESRRVAALEQTVADLARRVGNARGLGVNTAFGATHTRTTQLGFPAELTSAWSASTGYSWKRLGLDDLDVTDPGIQLTGDKAVTPGNNTSLTAGSIGWLEPDPDARGWVFIQDTNAASDSPISNCRSKFAGWRPTDCLTIAVLAGNDGCDNVAAQTMTADGDGTTYEWVGGRPIPVALGDGTLTIYRDNDGDPAAKIVVDTGSAGVVTVVGTYVACSGDYLEWAFSGTTLCDGTFVACGDNTFRVRAKCAPCPEPSCCPDLTIPTTLYLTVEDLSGTCACVEGTYALTGSGDWTSAYTYAGAAPCGGGTEIEWALQCLDPDGPLQISGRIDSGAGDYDGGDWQATSDCLSPVYVVFDEPAIGGASGSASFGPDCPASIHDALRFTLSEVAP